MNERYIQDYMRLIGSISLPQSEKDRIATYLVEKSKEKKELSKRYFAAASAVAVLAISTVLIARGTK